MNKKNDVEVIINNKRYILCGYESGEYLQKVASYINNKHVEFKSKDFYRTLDSDMRSILMQINIADDYFKALSQIKEMEEDSTSKSDDIYEMKHQVIAAQTQLEESLREFEKLKTEYQESQKKIVKLETELEDSKKHYSIN